MTQSRIKQGRIRLDRQSYNQLCRKVLERDGWRCQLCGCFIRLQVHHINPRSRLGADKENNLVTLCADCHNALHHARKTTPLGWKP